MTDNINPEAVVTRDKRTVALIERIGTVADLLCQQPLPGDLGDVAYDLLRQAAAQISSDRLTLARPRANEAAEPVAEVLSYRQNECQATVKIFPGLNGSMPFDVGAMLYAHPIPTSGERAAGPMTAEEHRLEHLKMMAKYAGPIVSFEVSNPYYLASCNTCGWVGSSEQCGTDSWGDDSDVYCPRCQASGADCGKVAELIGTPPAAASAEGRVSDPLKEAQAVWRCAIGDVVTTFDMLRDRWSRSRRKHERESAAVLGKFCDLVWAARSPAAQDYRQAFANGKALTDRARAILTALDPQKGEAK